MADLIKIKGGSGNVPALQDRELAVKKNGKQSELYCGINGENVRLCGANDKTMLDVLNTTVASLQATIAVINASIEEITARLEVLETPEAPSE